jgi:hypothetical protein
VDFEKILSQLREQRDLIDRAIVALETLERGRKRGRGRPRGWMRVAEATTSDRSAQPRSSR